MTLTVNTNNVTQTRNVNNTNKVQTPPKTQPTNAANTRTTPPVPKDKVNVPNQSKANSQPVKFVENRIQVCTVANVTVDGNKPKGIFVGQPKGIIGRAISGRSGGLPRLNNLGRLLGQNKAETPEKKEEIGYRNTSSARNIGNFVSRITGFEMTNLKKLTGADQKRPEVGIKFVNNPSSTAKEKELYSPNRNNSGAKVNENWTPTKGDKILYMNGVLTEKDASLKTARTLSMLTGGKPVESAENPTQGALDFIETAEQRFIGPMFNKSLKIERDYAAQILHALENGQKPKLIAHSQGSVVTANALQLVKDKLIADGQPVIPMMKNIDVVIMGPFANSTDFPRDVNIVEMRDMRDPVSSMTIIQTGNEKPAEAIRYAKHSGESPTLLSNTDRAVGSSINRGITTVAGTLGVVATQLTNTLFGGELYGITYHSVDNNYLSQPNIKEFFNEFGNKSLEEIRSKK